MYAEVNRTVNSNENRSLHSVNVEITAEKVTRYCFMVENGL